MKIYIDGGARGNPGPAGAGVLLISEEGDPIHEGAYFLGKQTNNAAEYYALIHGLQRAAEHPPEALTIHSDSQLLVRQITGEYRVKNPRLAQLYQQVQLLLLRFQNWNIRHIPREENGRADELANIAMDQQNDVVVFDRDQPADGSPPETPAGELTDAPSDGSSNEDAPAPDDSDDASDTIVVEIVHEDAPGLGDRAVRVTTVRKPRAGACLCAESPPAEFLVRSSMPAGICLHAAHALLPTVIAMLDTDAGEYRSIPTLTVRCMRGECGATFHVAPDKNLNGRSGSNGSPTTGA